MSNAAHLEYLAEAVRWAPSADNSQPWRLVSQDGVLAAHYDAARVGAITFPADDPATLLALGAVAENLHQAANAAGISLTGLPDTADSYFRLAVAAAEPIPTDALIAPLFGRHTNRLRFRPDPLPTALIEWVAGASEGASRCVLVTNSRDLDRLGKLVGRAAELRFQTRELHELLVHSLRLSREEAQRGDGLDVATLHLPPGGVIMLRLVRDWQRMRTLNRVGAYKMFARLEADTFVNASAVVAITGAEGRKGAIEAGRLVERAWIEINRLGLAVHPFYVVADQLFRRRNGRLPAGLEERGEELADEATATLGLGSDSLYMLLRVGYPTRSPVRSRRLPLADISDL